MTFLRVTRDQRGYETISLLHAPRPGATPRVLYWYRSAPGVRVGRKALDEDAIRTIEEQHPEVDFDWPQLLEEANTVPPEVERRPERPRRKAPQQQPASQTQAAPRSEQSEQQPSVQAPVEAQLEQPESTQTVVETSVITTPANRLLDALVGREIAARLRSRYADVVERIAASTADRNRRDTWRERADALDPDRWATPEAILHGIQHADGLVDQLRREIS